jgi:uncharacterized protein
MRERTGFPAGVPCWIDTAQPDPQAAVEFYSGLFGWEFEDRQPADAPGHYFVARLGGRDVAAIGSQPEGAASTPMWNTYVRVDSADDTASKVTAAGGQVLGAAFDVSDAGRMAMCVDPGGASFCLWQARQHQGAQVVNEPNTWNWSDLHTHDPGAAAEFYAAVFGWEATPVDFGFGESMMWRRPGYGDFLATHDPSLRERHGQPGVPAGFSDAIGWMAPPTGESGPDARPHWHVTFASADTDAAVETATKLGGSIVAPPSDAGGVAKIATLRDPQGAVFTVSTYTPAT